MRVRFLRACIISAAALLGSSLAFGDTIPRFKIVKFTSDSLLFQGNTRCDRDLDAYCSYFHVQTGTDSSGGWGFVTSQIEYFSSGTYQSVSCSGPEFANAGTFDAKTLASTLSFTFDAGNPNCFFSPGPPTTMVFNMTGVGDPKNQYLVVGTVTATTTTDVTSVLQTKFEQNQYLTNYTGTNGFVNGAYSFYVTSYRNLDKTKTR